MLLILPADALLFTHFAIVYALYVPSLLLFLCSLAHFVSIYLVEYNYDDAHAISLLYYHVTEND